jgi:beta-mannosidase
MDLDGEWLATVADDDVRRSGIGPEATAGDWAPVTVPGHWQDDEAFADSDGPIMYRHHFRTPPPEPDRRRWLTLDGILYQADVWLDGAYLGDPEGYFFPHEFDITSLSRLGDEHIVALEVACDPQRSVRGRRNITGVLQQGHGLDQRFNPGGIWRSVRVVETGPVRIDRLRMLCRDADERRAHLRITARLDSARQCTATVRSLLDGEVWEEQEHGLAEGENDLEWTLDVSDPALWWPRAMGDRALVEVAVEVLVDATPSDRHVRTTGLRQITWNNWICSVNGERLYLKGANVLPTSLGLARVDDDDVRADVQLAVDLGLDALRVHGHVAHPELYRAADAAGILLLQDFPLLWGHSRAVRGEAVAQARAAVDVLGHHPSIALWNAHDDPAARASSATSTRRLDRTRRLMSQQLPSWNRTILDRWVKRSFERNDPTRTTIAHSGVPPHLPLLDGTDSHLWFGWHRGVATDLAAFAKRMPRMVRFVSDFGADSVPFTAPYLDDQLRRYEWPDLDWDLLAERHGYDRAAFEARLPPASQPDAATWREATQLYQGHVLKVQIETLRRLKYRPTGGFAFSRLADPAPLVSAAIVDHARVPKHARDVVHAACAPVVVVATEPPPTVTPGDRLRLDVHLVSDLREDVEAAVVDAVVSWPGGHERFRFGGPVPADDVVKVGAIDLTVPDAPGELTVELTYRAGERTGSNHYATIVERPDGTA